MAAALRPPSPDDRWRCRTKLVTGRTYDRYMSSIVEAVEELGAALLGFEPEALSGEDAARLVEVLIRGERLCGAARARAAARVEACGTYVGAGCQSGAEWLAQKAGTGLGQAAAALEMAKAVEALPATKAAFVSGQLGPAAPAAGLMWWWWSTSPPSVEGTPKRESAATSLGWGRYRWRWPGASPATPSSKVC